MKPKPNILWYCTDQQRFDTIASLGNPNIHTPHLDRLVREGVAFTHTYCQSPICLPSRSSFMTGRYPATIHANHNAADHFPPDAETTLVSRLLAEAGYECGLIGKLHLADGRMRIEPRVNDGFKVFEWSLGPNWDLSREGIPDWEPSEHAYADWLTEQGHDPAVILQKRAADRVRLVRPTPQQDNIPAPLHQTTWCSQRANEFIRRATRPWMLCVNPCDPHPPFDPPLEYFRRYDPASLAGPHRRDRDQVQQAKLADVDFAYSPDQITDDEVRAAKAGYYAMIELIDDQFGQILRCLDATGQRANTVIVFHSDHGEMLGDHGLIQKGCRFYEGLVRVPMIWSWPSQFTSDSHTDALVQLIDIAPTLLNLAGVSVPPLMQGRSLKSMLEGKTNQHHTFVRCEFYSARRQTRHPSYGTMYRDQRWKLIVYHNHNLGELYDLNHDPWEHNDLWDKPACGEIKQDLLQRSFDATVMAMDPGPPRHHPNLA